MSMKELSTQVTAWFVRLGRGMLFPWLFFLYSASWSLFVNRCLWKNITLTSGEASHRHLLFSYNRQHRFWFCINVDILAMLQVGCGRNNGGRCPAHKNVLVKIHKKGSTSRKNWATLRFKVPVCPLIAHISNYSEENCDGCYAVDRNHLWSTEHCCAIDLRYLTQQSLQRGLYTIPSYNSGFKRMNESLN